MVPCVPGTQFLENKHRRVYWSLFPAVCHIVGIFWCVVYQIVYSMLLLGNADKVFSGCLWSISAVLSGSVVSDSLWPHGVGPTRLPSPWGFSRQEYWNGLPCPPPGDLPHPGIKPRSPALRAASLLSEPQGKLKNTGVGTLSLLQGIFPTQELNWGLFHCRWILYQLNYWASPAFDQWFLNLIVHQNYLKVLLNIDCWASSL